MKNKRMYIIICCLIVIFCTACSKQQSEKNKFETISISHDFMINDECKELTNDLKIYLISIQYYYDKSDKNTFSSFEFSDSECISSVENLQSHKDDKPDISNQSAIKESYVKTKIIGYYLKIEYLLSEKELLVSNGNKKSSEWFTNLDAELNNIYEELSNGIQEQ